MILSKLIYTLGLSVGFVYTVYCASIELVVYYVLSLGKNTNSPGAFGTKPTLV